MTQPRKPLSPSSKIDLASRTLAGQGQYGVVTDLARQNGVRRSEVYAFREQARNALDAALFFGDVDAPRGSFTLELTDLPLIASCRIGILSPEFSWNVEAFPTLHHLGGSRFMVGERMMSVD